MATDEQSKLKEVRSNYGPLRNADAHASLTGSCGDTIDLWLKAKEGVISESSYLSDGDEASQKGTSLLAYQLIGKTIKEAQEFNVDWPDELSQECISDLKQLLTVVLERLEVATTKVARQIKEVEISKSTPKADRRTLMVMSGKGGMGKSTVAINIALSLAAKGKRVGLVDVDVHGPSIPTMLNIPQVAVMQGADGIQPVILGDMYNLEVMSVGFLLHNADDPVVWRGPLKHSLIDQFLNEVAWGPLDYLIIDSPPGTGDEPLSVAQKLNGTAEAILVTTPQQVSSVDVARSINFCKQMGMELLGIVENMSGFVCPHCHTRTDIFRSGGGAALAQQYAIELLGSIPIDPSFGLSGDAGIPYVTRFDDSPAAEEYRLIVKKIEQARSEV